MFSSVNDKINKILDEHHKDAKFSFITDIWSETSAGVLLLSLTAHIVKKDFDRINFVLSATLL